MATKKTISAPQVAPKTSTPALSKAQLPAGYVPVAQSEYGSEWQYTEQPVLEGVVQGEVRTVEVKYGRDLKNVRVLSVADHDGVLYSLWESATLRPLFDAVKPGDHVAVVYQGTRVIKGRKEPMKVFTAGIKPAEAPKRAK